MFYGIPEEKKQDFNKAVKIILDIYPNVYAGDMLFCMWRNLAFRNDEPFMESYRACVTNKQEESLLWRLHVLGWAAKNALNVEGVFIECGVFKGFCSAVLCKYLEFNNLNRNFYLYDTFSGLPEETSTKEERKDWDYSDYDTDELFKNVVEVFSEYNNVEVIKGIVPDVLEQSPLDKVAFLHIDMNSEKAEILALEYLFDRVVPGGIIVLDDFGWSCNRNQTVAELAFMNARQHYILELPTGQGVILKHG